MRTTLPLLAFATETGTPMAALFNTDGHGSVPLPQIVAATRMRYEAGELGDGVVPLVWRNAEVRSATEGSRGCWSYSVWVPVDSFALNGYRDQTEVPPSA